MNGNPYISGWCTACGRRRGNDGRCVNCDPWWTSPLVQVGGPLLAVSFVLLVGLVLALASPKSDHATQRPRSTSSPFSAPAPLHHTAPLGPLSAPQFQPASAPAPIPQLPASFFAAPPDPDAAMMANLAQLRYQVSLASGQMRHYQTMAQQNEQHMKYHTRSINALPANASSL